MSLLCPDWIESVGGLFTQ
uniref:Uncharacterized protein n=1 Tax=Anguilla anguilla TaxID=7936 RepID=A0A0E9TGZ1_ANGAN